MGKALSNPDSNGGSGRLISASVLRALFARPVTDSLQLRRSSPLWLDDDFFTDDLAEEDFQDSKDFILDAPSNVDQKLEFIILFLNDFGCAICFLDPAFDNSGLIASLGLEQEHSPAENFVFKSDDFIAAAPTSLSGYRRSLEFWQSLTVGLILHLTALSLLMTIPSHSFPGFGGTNDKPILVRLTELPEIEISDKPAPASMDSPASAASLARRTPKTEEKTIQEVEKPPPIETKPKEILKENLTKFEVIGKSIKERVFAQEWPDLERTFEGPLNHSKSLQDSMASTPSVATREAKAQPMMGNEARTYRDLVLSAIHEAAYYPRAALRNKAHGQAVVSFTINKDGSLANVAIVKHASSPILDEAALKIVEKASSKFPPIPEILLRDQISYAVPIVFKKRG